MEQHARTVGRAAVGTYDCPYHGKLLIGVKGTPVPCERFDLLIQKKAKDKGPTQADCVAHGLGLAFMTGMFKKNRW